MPVFDVISRGYNRGYVLHQIFKLNNDEIKKLPLAPLTLIAAPGTRRVIHAVSGFAIVRKPDGSYTIPSADDSFYLGNANESLTGWLGSLFDATHANGSFGICPPITGAGGSGYHGSLVSLENQPLQIVMASGAALTGGGPNNTLTLLVSYAITTV